MLAHQQALHDPLAYMLARCRTNHTAAITAKCLHEDSQIACFIQSLECCLELLEMLSEWLPQHYPDRFSTSNGQLHNLVTGEAFDLNAATATMHPLEAASLLVQVWTYAGFHCLQSLICLPRLIASGICHADGCRGTCTSYTGGVCFTAFASAVIWSYVGR